MKKQKYLMIKLNVSHLFLLISLSTLTGITTGCGSDDPSSNSTGPASTSGAVSFPGGNNSGGGNSNSDALVIEKLPSDSWAAIQGRYHGNLVKDGTTVSYSLTISQKNLSGFGNLGYMVLDTTENFGLQKLHVEGYLQPQNAIPTGTSVRYLFYSQIFEGQSLGFLTSPSYGNAAFQIGFSLRRNTDQSLVVEPSPASTISMLDCSFSVGASCGAALDRVKINLIRN